MKNLLILSKVLMATILTTWPLFASAAGKSQPKIQNQEAEAGGGGPGGGDVVDGDDGAADLVDFVIDQGAEEKLLSDLKGYERTRQQIEFVRARVPSFANKIESCATSKKWILTPKSLDQGLLKSPVKVKRPRRLARQTKFEIRIDLNVYNLAKVTDIVAGETWFHELLRCATNLTDDKDSETVQDLNRELHNPKRTPEQLQKTIESHGGGYHQTIAQDEADRRHLEKMTYEYQQSLAVQREFDQTIEQLATFCNEKGEIAPGDTQKISSSLKFLNEITLQYEKKGLVEQKIVWDQRTRQQKFYYNISQVLSGHLGHILAELKNHKNITEEEFQSWVQSATLPSIKPSEEERYVTGWKICHNMSKKSIDFVWILHKTGFVQGFKLLEPGFSDEEILRLKDPNQHTSYGFSRTQNQ